MPFSVQRAAVASPEAPPGISVRNFFEEQLSSTPVALVPKNYEFSGDPKKKLGEEAEKKVFDVVALAGRDIPDRLLPWCEGGCRKPNQTQAGRLLLVRHLPGDHPAENI